MIAKDLYLLRREVERLEEQVKKASFEEQKKLKDTLRKKRAELNRMQKMLDGAKEPPSYRRPR